MTLKLSNALKTAALAGTLGLVGLAGSVSTASAHYTTTRCYGDQCRVVRCDNDGDECYRIRTYYRGDEYYRPPGRRWVCDWDGDCHWAYRHYYRPHFGVSFGWHG